MEPIELPGWAGGFDGQGSGDSSAHDSLEEIAEVFDGPSPMSSGVLFDKAVNFDGKGEHIEHAA
jgi:hypothetical protein